MLQFIPVSFFDVVVLIQWVFREGSICRRYTIPSLLLGVLLDFEIYIIQKLCLCVTDSQMLEY